MGSDVILGFVGTIIVGVLSLIGVILTNNAGNKKIQSDMENKLVTHQAVTDTKLDNLTEEVKKHNNFAMKIPAIEQRVSSLEKEVDKLSQKM